MARQSDEIGGMGDAFPLAWLPTELLGGVTQRLQVPAKRQTQLVDGRLAAVTRNLAWRHRSLSLYVPLRLLSPLPLRLHAGEGDASVELSVNNAAAVTRRFIRRATVVELKVVRVGANAPIVHLDVCDARQAQMRAVAAALCAPVVRLRSLLLEGTATELFGEGGASAAALFRRHAATLEQAALGFSLRNPDCQELYDAVRSCSGLRRFTCRLMSCGESGPLMALLDGWPLCQCALTVFSSESALSAFHPQSLPNVQELQLCNFADDLQISLDKRLTSLRVLRIGGLRHRDSAMQAFVGITDFFFKRADTALSLSAQIDFDRAPDPMPWVTLLQLACGLQGYGVVHVECFDAAVCAEEGVALPAAPPPPLPPLFTQNGRQTVITLERPPESRRLLFLLSQPAV